MQQVLLKAKQGLGEILSAVEFLDQESMHLVTEHLQGVRNPLQQTGPAQESGDDAGISENSSGSDRPGGRFYMVVETQGSNAEHDQQKLEGFLEVGNWSTQ